MLLFYDFQDSHFQHVEALYNLVNEIRNSDRYYNIPEKDMEDINTMFIVSNMIFERIVVLRQLLSNDVFTNVIKMTNHNNIDKVNDKLSIIINEFELIYMYIIDKIIEKSSKYYNQN